MRPPPWWEQLLWAPLRAYWEVCLRIERRKTKRLRKERLRELEHPNLQAIRELSDENIEIFLDLLGDDPLSAPLWQEKRRRSDERR